MPEFDEEKFEIERAADALMKAEEIKRDPDMFEKAKKELKKRAEALGGAISSMKEMKDKAATRLKEISDDE